ncbi:MAG TPA: hypothetical protein VF175_05675, partial [Lacipirellula sp.]
RFSLATLLLLTTIIAGGLAVWRAFIYEPPTHKIALYERAPGTRGSWIDVGPNRIGLKLIARNDRDGSVFLDQQRSSSVKLSQSDLRDVSALGNPARWLEIVQIELDPKNQLDIIETRVFDHEKRELLPEASGAYGWRQIGPNSVQIYGLGRLLPAKLDVWFRAHSYEADDPVAKLAPTSGATCKLTDIEFTLCDIRAGSWSYRSGQGLIQSQGSEWSSVTTLLGWQYYSDAGRFQMAAITKSGEKVHMNSAPRYIALRSGSGAEEPIHFHVPLEDIDHFEVRPFGGQHVFFFEAVELPLVLDKPFAPPPIAIVDISGNGMQRVLKEFAPLELDLGIHRGEWAKGTAASGMWAEVTHAPTVKNEDSVFTITYECEGLDVFAPKFTFLEAKTDRPLSPADLRPGSSGLARGAVVEAGYLEFMSTLKRVNAVEVTIGK